VTEEENLPPVPEVDETVLSRRAALARLGLAVSAAYVAPTILHIDRSANAFVVPSPCSSGRGRRRRRCRKKGGKNKSSKGKSKGGGRSGRGRQSRNNRRRNNSRRRQANNRRRRNSGGTNRRRW
jgi:hypothetical protein